MGYFPTTPATFGTTLQPDGPLSNHAGHFTTKEPAAASEKPAAASEKPAAASEKPAEASEKPAEASENPRILRDPEGP